MILVDASVALKWFIAEPNADLAARLSRENELAAPDLLYSELGNGLWKAVRSDVLTAADACDALATLPARIDLFLPSAEVFEDALAIALELDHPVYDCIYLAHAACERLPLVTEDQRLIRKLAGSVWAKHCQSLADAVG